MGLFSLHEKCFVCEKDTGFNKNKTVYGYICKDCLKILSATHINLLNIKKYSVSELKNKVLYLDNHSVDLSKITFSESLPEKLVCGDLPWGWVSRNAGFTEQIQKDYDYFMNLWINARSGSPKELYSALKSFVLYMEDVEKLCKERGECFEFWFNTILTGEGYLQERRQELDVLSKSLWNQQSNYLHQQELLSDLELSLSNFLEQHNGILQKDIYRHFEPCIKPEIQDLLYKWEQSGKIKRKKTGNTYTIVM